jgi:hypothetical protein
VYSSYLKERELKRKYLTTNRICGAINSKPILLRSPFIFEGVFL